MALTLDQKAYIQDYVYQVVTYQETYEEVSDHLITAMDKQAFTTENELAAAMVQLVEEDFGGVSSILHAEQQRSRELLRQQTGRIRAFGTNKWLWLGLILAFCTVSPFLFHHVDDRVFVLLLWCLSALPFLYSLPFRISQWRSKKSVKNKAMDMLASRLLLSFSVILMTQTFEVWHYGALSLVLRYMNVLLALFLAITCWHTIRLIHQEIRSVILATG